MSASLRKILMASDIFQHFANPQVDGRLDTKFIRQDIATPNFKHDIDSDFECDISRQETREGWYNSVAQVTLTYPLRAL
jgi:hypothetical protein